MKNFAGERLVAAIIKVSGESADVRRAALAYSGVDAWRTSQIAQVGAAGALACGIPGWHLVTLPADMGILLRKIARGAWGVGYLTDPARDMVDPEVDLVVILSLWAGEMSSLNLVGIQVAAAGAGFVMAGDTYPTFAAAALGHAFGNAAGHAAGAVFGKGAAKIVAKNVKLALIPVLQKVAVKLSAQAVGKMIGGFAPFLGAAVGGGINGYILDKVLDVAEDYYSSKRKALCEPAVGI